ncbi:hypothetical protein TNCV_889961 [Trichonephila clavipes]|nr:hypothetical protein TNCV_889961 [Trichonephila clavipes]
MFVSPLMIASKAALESEKIASSSVVPESSRWVEYRMSASLIARSGHIRSGHIRRDLKDHQRYNLMILKSK